MRFPIPPFVLLHVTLSLLGIAAGGFLVRGWIGARQHEGWSVFFLVTTFLANLTGFGFPFTVLLPGHVLGALALLVLLPLVLVARYRKELAGGWRRTYVLGALSLLYCNVFILVVQLFKLIPLFITPAPAVVRPLFLLTELLVLGLFVRLGRRAVQGSGRLA